METVPNHFQRILCNFSPMGSTARVIRYVESSEGSCQVDKITPAPTLNVRSSIAKNVQKPEQRAPAITRAAPSLHQRHTYHLGGCSRTYKCRNKSSTTHVVEAEVPTCLLLRFPVFASKSATGHVCMHTAWHLVEGEESRVSPPRPLHIGTQHITPSSRSHIFQACHNLEASRGSLAYNGIYFRVPEWMF